MQRVYALAEFAPSISSLVHELQKERGASAVYIGGGAEKLATRRLSRQRALTDHRLLMLDQALKTFDPEVYSKSFADGLEGARATVARLENERVEIDQLRYGTADMARYFANTIADLLQVVGHMSSLSQNVDVTTAINGYMAMLQTKERAGLERALGAGGFAAGRFPNDVHFRLVELVGQQEAYLTIFHDYATADQRRFYQQTLSDPIVDEMLRMRQIAIDYPYFGDLQNVAAGAWYDATTRRINLMKVVVDRLSTDLLNLADGLRADAQRTSTLVGTNLVLLTIVLTMFGLILARDLSRPLSAIAHAIKLLRTDDSVVIPGVERRDEIGQLARAFKQYLAQNRELAEELRQHQTGLEQEIDERTKDLRTAKENLQLEAEKLENQDWVKSNLLEVAIDLQQEVDLHAMAKTFLHRIMPLIDGQLGTVYLAECVDDDAQAHLSILGSYGYQPAETAPRQFAPGEGLIGQAAINPTPTYVDNVPSDYLRIVSASGERHPAFIALIPILFQGKLRAIVELASFNFFNPASRELIEQLAVTLGVMIDSIAANQLTSKLLGESTDLAERLEKERSLAVQANQSKSDFLANMSHEIRTPMNGILGTAELLRDSELNERQQQYAETIFYSSEILLALINDILDFSKIEAGELTLECAPFDLLRVVEDVAELLAPKAFEKMIDLTIRFAPGTPRFVIGDSVRIRQVLCSLVGNAIKFTETGYVLIAVETGDDKAKVEDGVSIKILIKDTGIGIPKDKLDLVFGRFSQADGSTTRQYGGTGLGLAICKKLVKLMGGKIAVDSTVGEGSTFFFNAILRRDDNLQDVEPDRSLLEGAKLLIVDDIAVNRTVLCEQLGISGIKCTAVANGNQAMSALREAQHQGEPFDLAILDYMMPEENGVQLAARIGNDPTLAQTTLIMLSSADPGSAQEGMSTISAFLAKPARQMQLLDTLASLQTAKIRGEPLHQPKTIVCGTLAPQRQAETALAGLRVLLVEDNRVNRELVKENLAKLHCEVMTAEHGKEAVAQVMEQTFDAILMDCQMPVMDGFEATRIISEKMASNEISKTPIIALTANAMQGDRERCLEAGMDDYATKPIRKQTLIDVLTRWCVIKENQAAIANIAKARTGTIGTDQSAEGTVKRQAPSTASAAIDLDLMAATQETMGDQFPVILEYYLEDAAQYVEQIAAGLASHEAKTIVTAAHPLKSSSRQLGVIRLSEIAKDIEEKARAATDDDSDLTPIGPLVDQLHSSLAESKSLLDPIIAQGGITDAQDMVAEG